MIIKKKQNHSNSEAKNAGISDNPNDSIILIIIIVAIIIIVLCLKLAFYKNNSFS